MVSLGDLIKVDRSDILDFPGDTIDLILELQKDGWHARRSNKNHVVLLAPDGVSRYSASRNPASAKYLAEDVRRYKNGEKMQGEPESEGNRGADVVATLKFPCPQADCMKFFVSQEKVNVHLAVDHEGQLKCPDCDQTRENKQKLSLHRTRAHGYESPRKAQRKAQEANRKAQEILEATTVGSQDILEQADAIAQKWVSDDDTGDVPGYSDVEEEARESTGRALVVEPITPEQKAFKELSKNVEVGPIDWTAYNHDSNEVAQQLNAQIGLSEAIDDSQIQKVDFIDERNSWTLDFADVADRRVSTLQQVLKAAGLEMEIRVWKTK